MMWMMGYNYDGGEFTNNINEDPLFTGRSKLRPLMPRPTTNPNPPCFTNFHGTDFLGLNHHHLAMVEQNKREVNMSQQVVVSSRWNPTPEQLQTLEELYRRGTRTPSAEQIQQITAQLRRYGKIEGKNVFYWFQNHKARERQKRRRQLESLSDEQPNNNTSNNNNQTEKGEKTEPRGSNRTAIEDEQTKNWASPTNSSTIAEKTTVQGASKEAGAECKADGWVQFDDAAQILQQQRRNATWQMMHLSCSNNNNNNNSSSSCSNPTTNLILNPSSSTHSTTIVPSTLTTTMQIKQPHDHHPDFINMVFLEPHHENLDHGSSLEAQTLELFPLRSGHGDRLNDDECDEGEGEIFGGSMNSSASDDDHVTTPYQFFEFLPLKN